MRLGKQWDMDARTLTIYNYYQLAIMNVKDNIQNYGPGN